MNNYVIFTIGYSLSGKTYLVEKILEKYPKKFLSLSTKDIHEYLNKYSVFIDDNSINGESYQIRQDLTDEIQNAFLNVLPKNNISVIFDSCNQVKKERDERIKKLKEINKDIKIIYISMNTPLEDILTRARNEDIAINRNVWVDLINKQKSRLEIPTKDECDILLNYDGYNFENILRELGIIIDMHS